MNLSNFVKRKPCTST